MAMWQKRAEIRNAKKIINHTTYIYIYNHYPFKEGGRTQIARHNLDVFEGGGPVKCWQAFIFLTASCLQDFILVGPLILYGISFIFLKKRRGAFNIVHCMFEKKCKNM